jgi:hypothetical protein
MVRKGGEMLAKLVLLTTVVISAASIASAQTPANPKGGNAPPGNASGDEESNINAYIDLLRSDVRAAKVQVLTEMMEFTADEAAVFWPIYTNYDSQMKKQGDARLAALKEYGERYRSLTDAQADELVTKLLALRSQREEMLVKCYQQVREKMGGKVAARFLQIENQLLLLIDLKIASVLPAVE